MISIKQIQIIGFKKFKKLSLTLNENINIIVGENESGKSSILEAINLVLNQTYKNYDKYVIKDLINKELIENFISDPKYENLPYITIDIELNMDDTPHNAIFYGTHHNFSDKGEKFGISFTCKFQNEYRDELLPLIENGKIPFDYYSFVWNTFQGSSYSVLRKPLNFLLIDNDSVDSNNSYNYYNKALFNSSHDKITQTKIKNDFRIKLDNLLEELDLNKISDTQNFGFNNKKMIFENIITVLDDGIPIENKGKGMENLIKTEIALDKRSSKMDIIALEEPENHLSYTNLKKMISDIATQTNKQLIVTTHESLIVNCLNLKNVKWIRQNYCSSLDSLSEDDANFFIKSPNNNMLQFLLSPKVILVEGPTEFLLLPKIYNSLFNTTPENDGISIISCGGVSYKRYLSIAQQMNKKVAVITDNDKKTSNIQKMNTYNLSNTLSNIFMDSNLDNFTWEKSFYDLNKEKFDNLIEIDEKANYLFHDNNYGKVLGKMLNNKVDTAYQMLNSKWDYTIPKYVEDALKWIRE